MIRWPKRESMNKNAFPLFWLYELYESKRETVVVHNGRIVEQKNNLSEELEHATDCKQERSRGAAKVQNHR